MKKFWIFVICIYLAFSPLQVHANSAQMRWEGVDASGAVIMEKNCPIIVEHETLILDIQEFPLDYYQNEEDFLTYTPTATARYTFYNPADYTVSAKLAFPFGAYPDYSSNYYESIDADKYGVRVNEASVEKQIRHTLTALGGYFNVARDLPLLSDGYAEDSFYHPELPVTMYVFAPRDVDLEKHKSAYTAIDLSFDPEKTRGFMKYGNGFHNHKTFFRLGEFVDQGDEYVLYLMGEDVELPEWKFYSDQNCSAEIDGQMELLRKETMTFEEMVMEKYPEDYGVSKSDWYNAVVASANEHERGWGIIDMEFILNGQYNVRRFLLRWFAYEITLEPGQRITNEVTVPMYPDIDGRYEPPLYGYTYLLSPASTWAQFGTLDIQINTPYYIVGAPAVQLEKTADGYAASLDGLPEGELEFTLSTVAEPEEPKMDLDDFLYSAMILLYLGWPLIALAVVIVVIHIVRKKRKK